MSLEFEWDDAKAASNFAKHGVAFDEAVNIFLDANGVEWLDNRQDYGEERFNLLGMSKGTIFHLTYTERNGRIRIISARQATKYECENYYCENAV